MWISSLVVTLSESLLARQAVRTALTAIPVFTLGNEVGNRLPVVVEAGPQDSRHWFDWIGQLPGVVLVEVAFVSFEEVEAEPSSVLSTDRLDPAPA